MVCRGENVEWVKRIGDGVWSAGTSLLRGSRGLLAECGLSGQVWRVGQENCWRSVVCRGEIAEWVKKIVGGVWSVGAKRASGSKELSAEFGLSGRKGRVGQENCWRSVVCRDKFVAWVKGIGDGVWSVGASLLRGSRELSARVVCRVKYGEWVKGIVGRVWSVGAKRASGSKELSAECGLSGRKGRVGQEACWRRLVCRDKFVAWVKGIVGGVWSVGSKRASGSRELSAGVVCRREKGEWVKGTVARVWSVGVKRASEPKKPHISYASNVANCHSDQNCQNPQNMIHLL